MQEVVQNLQLVVGDRVRKRARGPAALQLVYGEAVRFLRTDVLLDALASHALVHEEVGRHGTAPGVHHDLLRVALGNA